MRIGRLLDAVDRACILVHGGGLLVTRRLLLHVWVHLLLLLASVLVLVVEAVCDFR